MRTPQLLAAIVAAGLLLTGCTAGPGASPTPVASESPTPTPEEPTGPAIIVSLESVTVVDGGGASTRSVRFTDPEGIVSLMTDLAGGAAPVVEDFTPKGFLKYTWDGISVNAYSANALVTVTVPELGGLSVRTADGIHVGSSRSDLAALAPFDEDSDEDGDGVSDRFGLEAREAPGNESLSFPGQPGTDFIGVSLTGDSVTELRAPDSDYGDI